MRNNGKIALLLGLLLIVASMTGCGQKTPQKPNVQTQDKTNNQKIENKIARDTRKNNIDDRIDSNMNNERVDEDMVRNDVKNVNNRTNRISKRVKKLNEVNNATVVITGNTALVGVDINDNAEGKITNDLKRKIERTVKDSDKNIKTVAVTADADIYKRIDNMAKDIRNGKPISGFAQEIQEILRRITPAK